jgi:hypothetical protein
MVIRSSNILHEQPAQTHFFNCPKFVPGVKMVGP